MAGGPRARTAPDGLVVVDKPAGLTSHDVVARVRRLVGSRKVGHTGTLDPMATGVLVCVVERATRLQDRLVHGDKEYLATMRLGATTVSDDADGEILTAPGCDRAPSPQALEAALAPWRGDVMQRPATVSALKVDGQRAHARVRAGEQVELASRPVTVHELVALEVRAGHDERLGLDVVDVDLRVRCSPGTYVRALARDIGSALGCGAHLVALRRTVVAPFGLDDAATLDVLDARAAAEGPASLVLPLGEALERAFPVARLDAAEAAQVRHGVQVPWPAAAPAEGAVALLGPDGEPLALSEQHDGRARHLTVFG